MSLFIQPKEIQITRRGGRENLLKISNRIPNGNEGQWCFAETKACPSLPLRVLIDAFIQKRLPRLLLIMLIALQTITGCDKESPAGRMPEKIFGEQGVGPGQFVY